MCNLSWTPHSSLEKDNSLNHSCGSLRMGYVSFVLTAWLALDAYNIHPTTTSTSQSTPAVFSFALHQLTLTVLTDCNQEQVMLSHIQGLPRPARYSLRRKSSVKLFII